ncbi:cytoplasmic protein [Pelagibius sp. Alg239-R121]|uniref:cytoplasmic protein n=1 Tax=Pelagibius sp. Alg239-R121 TaxID=2993448 RepID=UPI0024A75F57|nr:cytoplasmic protein [Pelagibius sp. Alg239-R121]
MVKASDLPEAHWLHAAHKRSIRHRQEIEDSKQCGCFYCKRIFQPEEIEEWTDKSGLVSEQTALCPHCSIDSVIGDASGFDITETFLKEMNKAWF